MCVCVLESIAKGLVQKCDNGNRTGLIFLNSKSQINIMGKKIKKNACVCLVESLCCPAGINIVNQLGINKSKPEVTMVRVGSVLKDFKVMIWNILLGGCLNYTHLEKRLPR